MYKRNKLNAIFFLALTLALYTSKSFATLELNGIATYTYLGKEQFVAGLYSDTIAEDHRALLLADTRKQMEIKVVAKSLFSRRFKRLWIEGMAINSYPKELEKHAENVAAFSNMLKPRLKKNDILVITRSPRFGVDVSVNGIKLGNIKDPKFFDLLLRTWIGHVPLSTSFREALMQKGKIEPEILAMYQNISPTTDRINEVKQAMEIIKNPIKIAAPEKQDAPEVPPPVVEQTPPKEIAKAETEEKTEEPKATEDKKDVELADNKTDTAETKDTASGEKDKEEKPVEVATAPTGLLAAPAFDDIEEEEDDEVYTAENLLAEQLYYAKLMRWARRHNMNQKYPKRALRRNQQGTVLIAVTIERTGKVTQIAVEEASQYKVLNQAAQKTIKRASPFPSMPDEIKAEEYKFTVPVVFALRDS